VKTLTCGGECESFFDLSAAEGPLSTKDYRIVLEAVDIGKGRTFLHRTYSYGFGMAGRIAMKTYLATIGSAKVGSTQASSGDYIGGVRGLVERNTMRYYLVSANFSTLEIFWSRTSKSLRTASRRIEALHVDV
jgi:hypothetical protein